MAKETKKVKIQWYRSAIAAPEKHKVIVRSLGLTRLNQVVERPDTPAIRFLATVADVAAEGAAMGHCIASYAHSAVHGQCFLFHVEHEGEQASVQVGPDGQVVQAFGPRNRRNIASEWGAQALNRWGWQFPPLHKRAVSGSYAIGFPLPPPALLDAFAMPF